MEHITDFEKVADLLVRISYKDEFQKLIDGHLREHSGKDDPLGLYKEINVSHEKPGLVKLRTLSNEGDKETHTYNLDAEIEKKYLDAKRSSFRQFLKAYDTALLLTLLQDLNVDLRDALNRIQTNPFFNDFPKYRNALNNLQTLISATFTNFKGDFSLQQITTEIDSKKNKLSGNALNNHLEKIERQKKHWPKIIAAVEDTIGSKPLDDFITSSKNASSKLYKGVFRKYDAVPENTLKKWLSAAIKNGKLQDDLEIVD